jgi:hypothetical protein
MNNQKTIIDKINQAILYINNKQSHSTYGSVSSAFNRSFSMNHDYRTDLVEWYKDTSFHDADTMPQQILDKTAYFEIPTVYEKNMRFDFSHINLESIWGYGKFFDGESIEPTEKAEKMLADLSNLFSN